MLAYLPLKVHSVITNKRSMLEFFKKVYGGEMSLEDKITAIKRLLNGLNASLYKKGHAVREVVGVYEAI